MNKKELIEFIAEKNDISKAATERILNSFFEVVGSELSKDQNIQIIGFGTFSVSHRAARTGRNPRTGEPLEIKASKVPSFKAGKSLKEQVNG